MDRCDRSPQVLHRFVEGKFPSMLSDSDRVPRLAVHPGEVLAERLAAHGLSIAALARALELPQNDIAEIVRGRRPVTTDAALLLAAHFDTSARAWLDLQTEYDRSRLRFRIQGKTA